MKTIKRKRPERFYISYDEACCHSMTRYFEKAFSTDGNGSMHLHLCDLTVSEFGISFCPWCGKKIEETGVR